jgi:hypothetical protein
MQKVLDVHACNPSRLKTESVRRVQAADTVTKIVKDENRKVDPHAGLSVSNQWFADMSNPSNPLLYAIIRRKTSAKTLTRQSSYTFVAAAGPLLT